MVAPRQNSTLALIDELLAEQGRLQTPVARFASAHDSGSISSLAARHSSLIPFTTPRPGEQYAFEVELDSCTGCKSCVSACHSLNGLDDGETWRDTGLLVGGDARHPFTQTITTACHHCADPACLNGCPVLAYEKDPVTGIVRHLDDQCIGCSYCVLKCPYDVPKYNARLGIVRKCDMCHGRLAAGEAPACAQACPTQAIRIVTVPVRVNGSIHADTSAFLPGAPDPAYTQPTTRYMTKRGLPPDTAAADSGALRPQPPHWPLVVMLTLLPLAVGCQAVAALPLSRPALLGAPLPVVATGAGVLGLAASVFHLGQPLRAWRIFLGWRKSWLSREALVFAVWLTFSAATLVRQSFAPVAAIAGIAGLFCSAMVYIDTRRSFWRLTQIIPRFFGTALVFGLAGVAPLGGAIMLVAKLAWESHVFRSAGDRASARLLRGPLRRIAGARYLFGITAALLLAVRAANHTSPVGMTLFALLFLALGELMERYLFFRAVDAPKMPGLPAGPVDHGAHHA